MVYVFIAAACLLPFTYQPVRCSNIVDGTHLKGILQAADGNIPNLLTAPDQLRGAVAHTPPQPLQPFAKWHCPGGSTLEKPMSPDSVGELCRFPDNNWACPLGCQQTNGVPYCADSQNRTQPCRASIALETFHSRAKPMIPVMHTYYEPTILARKGQHGRMDQQLLIWKQSWEALGWQTQVLTRHDAERHPEFSKLLAFFQRIPLGTNPDYDLACYLRYVAMAAVGGGWMSDFDSVPLGLPPTVGLPNEGQFTVYEGFVPSLLSGSQNEWDRVSHLMAKQGPKWAGSRSLFSDMMLLQALQQDDSIGVPHFLSDRRVMPGEALLANPSNCTTSQGFFAVHFSHYALWQHGIAFKKRPDIIRYTLSLWRTACQS